MLENAVAHLRRQLRQHLPLGRRGSALIAIHNDTGRLRRMHAARAVTSQSESPQSARMLTRESSVHIADCAAEQAYINRDPYVVAAVELGGIRTVLAVPMLKEDQLIGASLFIAKRFAPSPTSRPS